ncbi:hypothetical protein [Nocardia niwae]|uniref:Abortive infection protein-like C-terminal domain-containing protein n=1 Tax=Nocardia niwae TaxID=626084 RepID=A0ABV2XHJ3_9NOCA
MTWQPLSQRVRGAKPDGPYEGVPAHLQGPLIDWIDALAQLGAVARTMLMRLRMRIPPGADDYDAVRILKKHAVENDEVCLDIADAILGYIAEMGWYEDYADFLRKLLVSAGSVWTVSEDGSELTRVVTDEVQATFQAAVATNDAAASELREAWTNAFGRNGDPSDAWDHAIKAVEDVLAPVVVPNKAKATLGDVVGMLGAPTSASKWKMVLPGSDKSHDVAPLVAMLKLIWPNHDRHGGAPKRTPSAAEARSVVTLAATIIQWHREGWAVAKR